MLQAIRDSIVGLVSSAFPAAHPGIEIYYDNQAVDWNNLGDVFVTFEIKFYAGDQIGMAASPKTRYAGYVYVCLYTRDGLGSRAGLGVLEWFASTLGYASPGAVRLQAPEPDGTDRSGGWFSQDLKVQFHADQT